MTALLVTLLLALPADELEAGRAEHGVPALAVASVAVGGEPEVTVVGAETFGGAAVDEADAWHVGSLTKSMTTALAATMVADGLIGWDSTVGQVLPDVDAGGFADVTLLDLLRQTSGLRADPGPLLFLYAGDLREQRLRAAGHVLRSSRGEATFAYNNMNYVVAGAMLEAVGDEPWEDPIRARVFEPLGLDSAGFGAPPAGHPQGHQNGQPVRPDGPLPSDNPPVLGPAGTVHMSVGDLATYATVHLPGGPLLTDAQRATLHEVPDGGSYAAGLAVVERPWAGGRVLTHTGSNTMWHAVVWIAPERGVAYVACTNALAPAATDAAVGAMISAD